ncbi:MAG TPA: ATP-binding protein [Trebonia sp.]|nr:ATP-binding protein [Trebonia sp.]
MLPAEPRLPEARGLVEEGRYFIVHAPRQTGKTTTLSALARDLTAGGDRVALRFSCERAESAGDDYGAAELQVLSAIRRAAREQRFPLEWMPPDPPHDATPGSQIFEVLQDWAMKSPLPLALFFDEIDALHGQSLISVLCQLRDGFSYKSHAFPSSVVLCGLRDVRDYKAASDGDPSRLGTASPFNVAVKSLRIEDFSFDDVASLYNQHTEETGQQFTLEAVERAFTYSQGQPWLVNALAFEVIAEMGVVPPATITAGHIDAAKERLILGRRSHLDSLASKLNEPRVRKVIEPLIAGTFPDVDAVYDDDVSYVRDLGLVAQNPPVRVANPIYREVIVRVLGKGIEEVVTASPRQFLLPDGQLNLRMLLEQFAAFWIEGGETLADGASYRESGAQLVFMAYLQRIVNGGGYVSREYGVGRGRIDLQVRKPYGDHQEQREGIELKVWRKNRPDPLPEGLRQIDEYLARLGLDTGTLIIFDRRPEAAPIYERTQLSQEHTPNGREVTVLRA